MEQRYVLEEMVKDFWQATYSERATLDASNVHHYNTRYAAKQNLHKFRIKTNTGKRMVAFAIDLWQEIPQNFKDLNPFSFSKSTKNYLLIQQHQIYITLPKSPSPLI